MNLITKVFYLLAPLFIYVEIFGLVNQKKIYKPIGDLEIKTPFKFVIFYICKLIYLPWLIFGLFSTKWILFLIPILMTFLTFPILKSGRNFVINSWGIIYVILNVLILSIITYQGVVQ